MQQKAHGICPLRRNRNTLYIFYALSIINPPLDFLDFKCQKGTYGKRNLYRKNPEIKRPHSCCRINPDLFFRYDENRPFVNIEEGILKAVSPPGGSFHFCPTGPKGRDIVILKCNEPSLRWAHFVEELFSLCEKVGVRTVVTLGGMYDNVLHTDRIISGIASTEELFSKLKKQGVIPINYQGPGAIHSSIHFQGLKRGFECISLWCHCPYYLQGTTHFGLLSSLASLLSFLGNFELDTQELDSNWKELNRQVQGLIEKNPELRTMISEIRKAKVRGSWASMKGSIEKGQKVIHLEDFLKSR